jgi:protein involved in polysaccharide export with SLBB domain
VLIDPAVPHVPTKDAAPEFYAPPVEDEYRVQVGDKLAIRSYYDSQLNQDVLVRRDGKISLLLLGDIDVFGKSPMEIGKLLSKEYAKHTNAPEVTVSVTESVGQTVYVGGEVKRQSEQPLNGPLTVVQAITAAGGFLPTANTNQVLVLRRQADGSFIAYQIDVDRVLVNQASDIYLQRYDIVHVPMSRIAHVGRFVDLYINEIIPEALRFSVNYMWIDQISGTEPATLQVVTP